MIVQEGEIPPELLRQQMHAKRSAELRDGLAGKMLAELDKAEQAQMLALFAHHLGLTDEDGRLV